ncbi:haloacid dehalogenase-like hydrolase [Streptomyces sp. Termitarium-T10T-6]|nr:haloacid dehalogenase-like hydrolase [Streptomyces sp. Termitarium-T10T-6]
MSAPAPAAVLFDMDGTLVDTEVLWWETAHEVAAGLGHRLTDADAPDVVGRAVADTAAHLIAVTGGTADGLPAVAAELTGSFHRKVDAGAPLRPGAAALLAALERHRVPFALVSASPRSVVDAVVTGARGRGALRLHALGRRHRADQAASRSVHGRGDPVRGPGLGLRGRRGLPGRHRVRARRGVCRAGRALAAAGRSRAGEDLRP